MESMAGNGCDLRKPHQRKMIWRGADDTYIYMYEELPDEEPNCIRYPRESHLNEAIYITSSTMSLLQLDLPQSCKI